jgi:transcription-repair coupling factor (superfamily II helicase)
LAQDSAIAAASDLFARVIEAPAVQSLARRLEKGGVLSFESVTVSSQSFLGALLNRLFLQRPVVLVTESLKTQELLHQDLATWLNFEAAPGQPARQPFFYPAWEILPHESRLPHVDVISERLETAVALSRHLSSDNAAGKVQPPPIVVTNAVALLQRTFPRRTLLEQTRTLARGDRIEPLTLVEWLEEQGYEPEAQVTQKGELALRGGILDVFPLTSPWPVRMEFFGDELESLRHFDPITQLSRDEIASVTLPPAGELGLLRKKETDNQATSSDSPGDRNNTGATSGRLTQTSRTTPLGTLLDYLPSNSIFVLCEPMLLNERAEEYASQVPKNSPFFIEWQAFKQQATTKGMTLLCVSEGADDLGSEEGLLLTSNSSENSLPAPVQKPALSETSTALFQSLEAFRPLAERTPEPAVAEAQRLEFFSQMHRWLRQGYAVHVFCNNEGERQRFQEIWNEYGLQTPLPTEAPRNAKSSDLQEFHTHLGTLTRGFLFDEARLVVVTDAEIFGRYKVQRPRRLKSPHAQATRSALDIDFTDLEEGDYVVHLQHGIGRYLGLQVLPIGAGTKPTEASAPTTSGQECLVIEYAASDPTQPAPKLYVPVTEAHLVSKYVGTGKARPPLNTLGGTRWAKAKEHAERAVRDVAGELLSIQAARESQPGHAFAPDTPWQREFESAFLFEETPDQLRAIVEAKADMERPKPMDRLICGDVGFGKTEVAIRAAFKGVMDGRQVAVLVPTTVLAQQHFNTFRERMADYPVRVELLSRFRTRRAQQRVIKDLATGGVDIVIGTHRLLQKDIAFKDLGLVVIDEEQRFGVLHKEKFKMLRRLVDVLTLSATPIPRTLYLALTGARDMSTIQTPPHDRLPVETIVMQYDERVIRDAIQRELNRGGQVFFLHNRVLTIQTMAQKLAALVPQARIVVGHGQMHSDDLEEVMTSFVNGEADILLSTTIIESGLDIPNANTIIIDRADRFGLSDLYQLRGRVGRYKHQAYAYLLLPRHGGLLTDVRKRMSAIKQYSTLGSGFKIAMRDLEIRGAGNLLGAEQSGHITAVGFDLYCQLLKQSVSSLKGEKVKPRIEVQIRLDFLALSPAEESPKSKVKSPKPQEVASPEPSRNTQHATGVPQGSAPRSSAYIPFNYISDSRQRIEAYRKVAQIDDLRGLQTLSTELRDRFGLVPPALELLLKVAEIKLLAAERAITSIEVKDDKLMLTRNNDLIMVGSKFPRLIKPDAPARLKEIKKLLLAL